MGVTTNLINKPFNPRGNDQSPLAYNRAKLFSGKALNFDGVNDSVEVPYLDSLANTGVSSTFSFYFNADALTGTMVFAEQRKDTSNRYVVWYDHAYNRIQLYLKSSAYVINFPLTETGQWFYFTGVVDGSTAKMYINGELIGSTSYVPFESNVDFYLGTYNGASGLFYSGKMSNAKIFNTALTAAQVADLYNNPEKVVPTGVDNTALKLWLPMQEGAGTTAYDGSPSGFVEDIVTGFTNGTTYPLDSFASSGDDITTAIKTNGFGGCVSNGHYYTNGQKVKVKFTYQKNSGDDLRVLFSSQVTGAGAAKSDIQNVSASGEFEHTFTMTADGIAYLQLGTGNASHSIDAVITDVYVSPNVSANHGTISGATYVHGIGAPVSQTAVIDWNKGSNLVPDVNDFNSAFEVTTTTGLADDPAGRSNAVRFTKTTDTTPRYGFQTCGSATLSGNTDYVISLFYKYDGHAFTSSIEYNNSGHFDLSWVCNLNIAESGVTIASAANCTGKVVAYSNDWYRVDVELTTGASPSGNPQYLVKMQGDTGTSLLVAYAQLEQASSVGPLVPTFGTAQTSPVLLPQGLTTGRDITGVNLFENVRKQGALNLDGNSWAEVHDNASLDITDAITLEAWVYADEFADMNGAGIIAKWDEFNKQSYLFYSLDYNTYYFFISSTGANNDNVSFSLDSADENKYNHLVCVYDGSNITMYKNGSVAVTDTTALSSLYVSDKVLEIGRYDLSTTRTIETQIAQPRIYNRALTAEEVQRNYNAGKNIYTNS